MSFLSFAIFCHDEIELSRATEPTATFIMRMKEGSRKLKAANHVPEREQITMYCFV